MHSSLILLTLVSIILITFMVTCFICFIRSRRKEDEEMMEQVQYSNQQQQQFEDQVRNHHHQQQQQQQPQQQSTPQRQNLSQSPSHNILINAGRQQYSQQNDQRDQIMAEYQSRNSYTVAPSPYHSPSNVMAPGTPRTETRSDITQQINSAIIGSSEAEFQNDFIQVFPMYQIAPQPEKNTTPYLT